MTDIPKMGRPSEDGLVTIKMEVMDENYEDHDSRNSNTEEIVPQMMVSVQVEEMDDQALDFSSNSVVQKTTPNKKENLTQRRKKLPETPEERQERLRRDRARKSWARQNETPEQRKARLDYHKKYKRKSRAKPKESQIPGAENKCSQCSVKFDSIEEWQEHIKTHPWKEDHFAKFRRSQQNSDINFDPSVETEKIIVKVEPIDFDDGSTSNTFESPPNDSDFTPTEFDCPNETTFQSKNLTYTIQCAIINKMFKGRPISDICKLYNVTPEIVNELWDERDKYEVDKPGHGSHRHLNAKVEESVLQWLQHEKDNHIQVSGKMIQIAAEGFAKDLGFVTFDGSRKWLDRFKKKHRIMFGTRKRDYTANSKNKVKNQFFVEQWAEARKGLNDEDIYIADEVGLFYNPSKNRIQKLRGKKFVQGCVKDRLSIFLCTNATGTDKKKLLVCGTEDPLLHSHRDPQTLPVLYVRHAQAHFTTKIFEDYVTCWNRELEQRGKEALLILDRATIHTKLQLSNLKLLFVPYKSKNSLVPIRNGVYSRFRAEFRRLILEDKLMKCMNEYDRNITCLEALSILEKAWERIPREVITMSLFSIGYDVTMPVGESVLTPKVENDEEDMCEMLKEFDVEHYYTDISLLDEYLTVDDDLLTGQGTNASVFGGNHKAVPVNEVEEHLPIATEKPESATMEYRVKRERAMQDLDVVRKYLQSKDTNFGTYCALLDIEKFVTEVSRSSDS